MKLPSKDQLMSLYRKKRMVESISLDELIANRSKDNPQLSSCLPQQTELVTSDEAGTKTKHVVTRVPLRDVYSIEFIEGEPQPTKEEIVELMLKTLCGELDKKPGVWAKLPECIPPGAATRYLGIHYPYEYRWAGDNKMYVRRKT